MLFRIVVGLVLIALTELCLLVAFVMHFGLQSLLIWSTSTALIGLFLVKRIGADPWTEFKNALWQGDLPDAETLNSLLILLAGAILILPGIATDMLGLVLLMPGVRKSILVFAPGQLAKMMEEGVIRLLQWRSEEESSDERRGAIS